MVILSPLQQADILMASNQKNPIMASQKEGIMRLFKKIPITFEGKDYEIRVLYEDTTISVIAFLNNYPANGYRHQILLKDGRNYRKQFG
jgi:hypothetical protein